MLEKIKLLLHKFDLPIPQIMDGMTEEEIVKVKEEQERNTAQNEQTDKLLRALISLCQDEAYNYCNLAEYDDSLDYIVVQMVIERFNRIGSEGATSQGVSGMQTTYDSFYSEKVRKLLNKHRKVKTV